MKRRFSWPLVSEAIPDTAGQHRIDIGNIRPMEAPEDGPMCGQDCRQCLQESGGKRVVTDGNDNSIIRHFMARIKSSSMSSSSADSTTSCSSCRPRLASNSSSDSCSQHVIANENVLTTGSDTSSDSDVISAASVDHQRRRSPSDLLMPDQFILRELSEMRAILEQILQNREQLAGELGQHSNAEELFNLFGFSLSDKLVTSDESSDFPIGRLVNEECGVCLTIGWIQKRFCCQYNVCFACLQQYYWSRVQLGTVAIECINPFCRSYVHRAEIAARLTPAMKEVYHRLLGAQSDRTKPCPQCNHLLTVTESVVKSMNKRETSRVQCSECQLHWCFKCHSPWHSELSCKQYRKGDRLLKSWAKETIHGQVNAQRCPRCGIYIQRTSGCDHMHCLRCKTNFCYKCGDRLRRLKYFGDHYSKLSVFGCKYRFKSDQPLQRKLIRGAVFGSKVMLVPILGSLAVCAGAVVLVLGVAALPLYTALTLFRKYRNKKRLKTVRQQVVSTIRV